VRESTKSGTSAIAIEKVGSPAPRDKEVVVDARDQFAGHIEGVQEGTKSGASAIAIEKVGSSAPRDKEVVADAHNRFAEVIASSRGWGQKRVQ
jgi:hypothetical protein